MKKILAILLLVSILSCSVSDDSLRSHTEILPIESVNMPDEFLVNHSHPIELLYYLPSSCHAFNDIYYTINENERTVAIVSRVFETNGCEEIITEIETSFNFRPTELGTYIFKFWQGEDVNGDDQYYIVEIEVVE